VERPMNTKQTTNMMWTAFFMSVLIVHGMLLSGQLPASEPKPTEAMAYTLLVLGVLQLLAVVIYDLAVFGRPRTVSVRPEMLPPEGQPVDEQALLRELKGRYYLTRVIIVLAFAEAIGLYGFVLGVVGTAPWVVHTLFALSYTAMLYIRLRMSTAWERMYLG
jgi:hypothetical protein